MKKIAFPSFFLLIVCYMTYPAISIAENGSSAKASGYRIGTEDVLHVSVWGNSDLTLDNVIVRPDGKISMPLVMDIQAEGLTASELADGIKQRLHPYIKDPNVSVIVKEINSLKFSVIGNVSRPGIYPLRGDVSVLQGIAQAGGFTPFASLRKIKIVRKKDKKEEIRMVNYYEMIEEGGEGNILLKPGDTIVVP
jgi:polysaccharide export outer membrane protein